MILDQYAAWSHALTREVVGDRALLNITGQPEWYTVETVIYDRDGVSLVVTVTDTLDAVKSYEEPSLIHLMRAKDDTDV